MVLGASPAGHGHRWEPHTVRSILKNEKYMGDAILQKEIAMDFLTKTRKPNEGEAPQYYVENGHPGIVRSCPSPIKSSAVTAAVGMAEKPGIPPPIRIPSGSAITRRMGTQSVIAVTFTPRNWMLLSVNPCELSI